MTRLALCVIVVAALVRAQDPASGNWHGIARSDPATVGLIEADMLTVYVTKLNDASASLQGLATTGDNRDSFTYQGSSTDGVVYTGDLSYLLPPYDMFTNTALKILFADNELIVLQIGLENQEKTSLVLGRERTLRADLLLKAQSFLIGKKLVYWNSIQALAGGQTPPPLPSITPNAPSDLPEYYYFETGGEDPFQPNVPEVVPPKKPTEAPFSFDYSVTPDYETPVTVTFTTRGPILGGVGETQEPTDRVVRLLTSPPIQDAFEERTGITPTEFKIVEYRSQVVAGMVHFAKVRYALGRYAHIRVFEPLPHTGQPPELQGVQTGKSATDRLDSFNPIEPTTTTTEEPVGVGETEDPRERVLRLLTSQQIQDSFREETGIIPSEFEVIDYASQVESGTNYFAKVRYAPFMYAHIRVFEAHPGSRLEPFLEAVQTGKSLDDPISFFEPTKPPDATTEEPVSVTTTTKSVPGGLEQRTPSGPDDRVVKLITSENIQAQFEEMTGETIREFEVIVYAIQVVAGMNYFGKVRYSPDKYAHINVFAPLAQSGDEIELLGVLLGKSIDEPLVYFHPSESVTPPTTQPTPPPAPAGTMPGGLSEPRTPQGPDDEVVVMLTSPEIQRAFLEVENEMTGLFQVILYRTQVVAGTNYFAKIHYPTASSTKYAHIRVFKPLPHTGEEPELDGVQLEKSATDTIQYFEASLPAITPTTTTTTPTPITRTRTTTKRPVLGTTGPRVTPPVQSPVGSLGPPRRPSGPRDWVVSVLATQAIQDAFEEQTGITPDEFEVLVYRSQLVAGMNHFAKIRYAPNEYAHIRVYEPLPFTGQQPALHGVQLEKSLTEPVEYFTVTTTPPVETTRPPIRVGGLSPPQTPQGPNDRIVALLTSQSIQEAFTAISGEAVTEFEVIKYATQVVAGTNYFAKIRYDTDKYAHVRVFHPLPFMGVQSEPMLQGVQLSKSVTDPIEYFEETSGVTVSPSVTTEATPVLCNWGNFGSYSCNYHQAWQWRQVPAPSSNYQSSFFNNWLNLRGFPSMPNIPDMPGIPPMPPMPTMPTLPRLPRPSAFFGNLRLPQMPTIRQPTYRTWYWHYHQK